MAEKRPDPDVLLKQVVKEEERARQGKLKIFFGAAPGVGKTYAMLEAARRKLSEGAGIVAGIVETHGRPETEELLEGLEVLPRREIEYRGVVLKEFDLDAALALKPEIILVDELAHTNVPGCRHKKRWQDVFELLSAGINVYTTLNVQHIESLNDVVSQITGIIMRETLPDSALDRADEIELIDLPPEELIQRLEEGKVYVPDLASRAREHFFRKGNLLALRELALRRTAERVDEQMQTYRRDEGIKKVWPAAELILVCVGPNPRSIRLIRAAKRMAAGLRAGLIAVHVEAPSKVKASESDLKKLEEHMQLAESLGAETVTLSGHRASEEILNYARDRNVTKIIIGKPTHPRWKDKVFGSMLDEMVRGSGDIDVYVITGDIGEPVRGHITKAAPHRSNAKEWLLSIAAIGLCTGLSSLVFSYLTLVDIAMLYILGIVIVSSYTSKWPSLLATLLSVAAFDLFFVPPFHTFTVHDVRYFLTFFVMFIVALVISRMTLRIREQASSARLREKRTASLYSMSRELVREPGISQICDVAVRHIGEVFLSRVVVLMPDEIGKLGSAVTGPGTFALDKNELSVAQWAFDHRQEAGVGTDTLPGAEALYLPLITSSRTVGVLGILQIHPEDSLGHEQIHILESFANQISMGIDRALLAEEASEALLKAERETLRNTLLSSVSHDLRTPLAAVTGAATTLIEDEAELDHPARQELIKTIIEEAEHLNHIIRNVLNMTRLESGEVTLKKEWQSFEEIAGAALNRMAEKLKDRPVDIDIPADLPLVPFDPLLIEQVLINLLDNAIKYTPEGTPVELSASVEEGNIVVELADRGPGIPSGEEEKIFEKFVRGAAAGGGIGLGLTICHAIISAHGGHIRAKNRPGGGAAFSFMLPLREQPPLPEPEETE